MLWKDGSGTLGGAKEISEDVDEEVDDLEYGGGELAKIGEAGGELEGEDGESTKEVVAMAKGRNAQLERRWRRGQ